MDNDTKRDIIIPLAKQIFMQSVADIIADMKRQQRIFSWKEIAAQSYLASETWADEQEKYANDD
jgi:hypothetical protein